MDTFVDKSLGLVRNAIRQIGKRPLARLAGVPDGCLRLIDDPDWSPTTRTLRKLEVAAEAIFAERAAADASGQNSLSVSVPESIAGTEVAGAETGSPASATSIPQATAAPAAVASLTGAGAELSPESAPVISISEKRIPRGVSQTSAGAADPVPAASSREVAA